MSDFIVETFASIEEWSIGRGGGVGSSEAGALWNVSPYGSPRSLYEQKVNGVKVEIDPALAMWGHQMEPAIARYYALTSGLKVEDAGANVSFRSKRWPWMTASLDRIIVFADGPGVLEAKNRGGAGARAWREAGEGAPLDVQLQVTHQLAVTGWKRGVIGVALGGTPPEFIEVERDEELVQMHVERCREFWERVQSRNPPPVDGHEATTEALRQRFKAQAGKKIVLDKEATSMAIDLRDVKQKIGELDGIKRVLENHLREAIGDAAEAEIPGVGRFKMSQIKETQIPATVRKAHTQMRFYAAKDAK